MKKGFLFGGPPAPKAKVSQPKPAKTEDITFLKPKETKEEERRIPEVQEAMMNDFLEKNKGRPCGSSLAILIDSYIPVRDLDEILRGWFVNYLIYDVFHLFTDSWMTEDLLNKVQKNEKMTQQLANPKFVAALAEFQKNPKAASEKYKDSPEMEVFFKDFCQIMGMRILNYVTSNCKCIIWL